MYPSSKTKAGPVGEGVKGKESLLRTGPSEPFPPFSVVSLNSTLGGNPVAESSSDKGKHSLLENAESGLP